MGYWGTPIVQPDNVLALKDIHKGERAFIIGNGPSLREQEELLPRLNGELLFTCNKLPGWKDCPFRPDYHAFSEPDALNNPDSCNWFDPNVKQFAIHYSPVEHNEWIWVAKAPDNKQVRHVGFWGLGDELPPLPTAWTTPLTFAQLAAWMGVREFYFLGIDTTPQGYVFNAQQTRDVHPRIIRGITDSFKRARADIERVGGTIMDCTPNGLMNKNGALAYMELSDVLGMGVSA